MKLLVYIGALASFPIAVCVQAQSVVWHASSGALDSGESISLDDSSHMLEAGSGWLCSIGPTSNQLPAYAARQTTCSFDNSSIQFSVQCDQQRSEDHSQVRLIGNSTEDIGYIEVGCNLSDSLNAPNANRQDFRDALKRAEAGELSAQGDLAVMYEMGLGVPESDVKAYMWFSIAVAQSTTPQQIELYSLGKDKVKSRLTRQALEQAQSLASSCFESNFKDCGE